MINLSLSHFFLLYLKCMPFLTSCKLTVCNLELYLYNMGNVARKILLHANNNGTDQHAHPHSLISAFVMRCLDSAGLRLWSSHKVQEF